MSEKILIVDDDLDTLRLVGLLLQRKGYQILAASNGKQAIDKAFQEKPNLILLDVMMPEMDGYEVLRWLRNNPETRSIPVIMFTAKGQVDDKVAGFDAGANDYLTKPTHPAELLARVKTMLATTSNKGVTSPLTATPAAAALENGSIIGVLSAKGGIGVTTVVSNLGISLNQITNSSVILGDFRPGDGGMSLSLGIQVQEGLAGLLKKKGNTITQTDVRNSLIEHDSGLFILPTSYLPSDARYICQPEPFNPIIKHLKGLAPYSILDLGHMMVPAIEKAVELCDQLVIVVEPNLNCVFQTKALLGELSLRVLGLSKINVVLVNKIRMENQMQLRQVQDRLGHTVTVVITPAPELAQQANSQNTPMTMLQKESTTSLQFIKLAQSVMRPGPKTLA